VHEALSEVWELGVWMIRSLLGPVHSADMKRTIEARQFINSDNAMSHLKLRNIKAITADVTAIITTLHHALPKRKPKVGGAGGGGTQGNESNRGSGGTGKNMLSTGDERGIEIQGRLSYMMGCGSGFMWEDAYASAMLDRMAEDKLTLMILEKLHGLLGLDPRSAEPSSVEARRRLAFFTNSLFMDMPRPPPVTDMMSWSCMTPFYSEDVVYSRGDLERKNEDGLTTLMYLQALYKSDWRNFMERIGISSEQQALSKKHIESTRFWASFRAQTLARTVEGIMYYEAALRQLATVEKVDKDKVSLMSV
ncbi:unnamed protein product, partial [Sphacelaria rigidula]